MQGYSKPTCGRAQDVDAAAFANAAAAVAASGGSTNAILHLLAIAHERGIDFTIRDFDAISRRTPVICDLKPGGRWLARSTRQAGPGWCSSG